MNQPEVVIFDHPPALAQGAADRIADFIRNHPGPQVTVAMVGGSTPAATYQNLAEIDVPWERVVAWIGDERYVPPGHPDHNGTMVENLLLGNTPATFHQIPWEAESPHKMATAYQTTLRQVLPQRDGQSCPDLILAGIGDDGHTLSWFPGSDIVHIWDSDYAATWVEDKGVWRLTATLALVHRAEQIIVLAAGSAKAPALARILLPNHDQPLPARHLMEGNASVTWLIDAAAAAQLDQAF